MDEGEREINGTLIIMRERERERVPLCDFLALESIGFFLVFGWL
jgi:hypothetical protein